MNNNISLLKNDKEKYIEMKDSINRVIIYLDNAIDELESASQQIAANNIINDIRADGSKVEIDKNNLVNQVNWLRNTILPAIDNSINECDVTIDNLMAAMMAASSVSVPTINLNMGASIAQNNSKSTATTNSKVTITTSKIQSTNISSTTSVNKMQSKTSVKNSSLKTFKNVTTTLINSILGGIFK